MPGAFILRDSSMPESPSRYRRLAYCSQVQGELVSLFLGCALAIRHDAEQQHSYDRHHRLFNHGPSGRPLRWKSAPALLAEPQR